jgi:hypothetical protein
MTIVIDGTTGISGVDGTASNPSYEGTDSNTGIFYPAADTVAIGTGGTEALRVNSAQNVGVGTTSPTAASSRRGLVLRGNANGAELIVQSTSATDGTSDGFSITTVGTDAYLFNRLNGFTAFATNNTERARITSIGESELQSTTANGAYVRSGANFTLASNATINITSSIAGAALVLIYNVNDGAGAVFFANYLANSVKIAGDGAATDTGTTFAVYKNASNHVTTIRNRYATSQTFRIAVYSAEARP